MTKKTETPELQQERHLNFKDNKIQQLTLDELKLTVKEDDYNNKPIMGMYHWEFIEKATDVIENAGLKYELEPIWAAQNQDKARPGVSVIDRMREEYGDHSLRSYLLRRLFSRIIISDMEDELSNTAVALSYNQMGFQLAYGPNVKICQNLSILGADKFMTTYANENKMPNPARMLEVLGDWLKNFKNIRKEEMNTIMNMQAIPVEEREVMEIVGDLTMRRLKKDNNKLFDKEPVPPLNQSQIAKFTMAYLTDNKNQRRDDNISYSVWDIYNFATELYKPGDTDFPNLLTSNYAMGQYLKQKFSIN